MKFVIFQAGNDLWFWELRASDELLVATSPRGLKTRALALEMVDIVRMNVKHCGVFDRLGNRHPNV